MKAIIVGYKPQVQPVVGFYNICVAYQTSELCQKYEEHMWELLVNIVSFWEAEMLIK